MWTIAEYQLTTFFSLRAQTATTSGGKSLVVPTPFAVKMALLDAAIRTQGLAQGQALFPALRDLVVAVQPPQQIVVNNTFARILRLKEIKTKASEKGVAIARARANHQWPFQKTIGFREYVQFGGPLALAFQGMASEELTPLLVQVNYLGKRGGFMQLLCPPKPAAELPLDYVRLNPPDGQTVFDSRGLLQMLDDCGPKMTFEHADIYSGKRIRLGKERVLRHVVLPYRLVSSSKSFSYYERID